MSTDTPDGVDHEPPSPRRAVVLVLEDSQPGGVERGVLIDRAAELARATRADVERALNALDAAGETYPVDGEIKLTPSRVVEHDWGGFK